MLNNRDTTLQYLTALNLSRDEAKVYLELIREPLSHLEVSRRSGVNRTKVYRLVDQLQARSLVAVRTDDRGTFLVAADPATLEVSLTTDEQRIKQQRAIFKQLLPALENLQNQTNSPSDFTIATYEGLDGFRQMLWHELKAQGEVLVLGNGSIEDLIGSTRWAENHRVRTIEAGYTVRELQNPGKKSTDFTKIVGFKEYYSERIIEPAVITIEQQTVIYNNTVATYSWQDGKKVGFEVVNAAHARTMRQIFEHYWQLAA